MISKWGINEIMVFCVSVAVFVMIVSWFRPSHGSIPPTDDQKIMNFQCEKKENWTTLIHVNGSKDAIELKDIYCPYIKVD